MGELAVGQLQLHDLLDAARAELRRDSHVDAVDPVLAGAPGAHGERLLRVAGDGVDHLGDGRAGRVVRAALLQERDDLGAGVAGPLVQTLQGLVVHELGERLALHGGVMRERDHGLAM